MSSTADMILVPWTQEHETETDPCSYGGLVDTVYSVIVSSLSSLAIFNLNNSNTIVRNTLP